MSIQQEINQEDGSHNENQNRAKQGWKEASLTVADAIKNIL